MASTDKTDIETAVKMDSSFGGGVSAFAKNWQVMVLFALTRLFRFVEAARSKRNQY